MPSNCGSREGVSSANLWIACGAGVFVQDGGFRLGGGEGAGQMVVVMAVADDQAAVRALGRDQVHAVLKAVGALGAQLGGQGLRLRQGRIAAIAREAEVRH